MAGRFMLLAALFVEPHPAAPSLAEVIADVHVQYGPDGCEGIDHRGNQRPVTPARERGRVDGFQRRAGFLARAPASCLFGWSISGRARHGRD